VITLLVFNSYNKKIVKESYNCETLKVGNEDDLGFGVENSFTRIYKSKSSFMNIVEMKKYNK
jgi:hypothetical protein